MQGTHLDTVKSKINKGITTVSVKTSSSMEKAKLSTHMESVERELERLKSELGNRVYTLWRQNNFELGSIELDLETIENKEGILDSLKKQIKDIDNQANAILGKETKTGTPAGGGCICANCGSRYEKRINFCVQCGNKIV